MREPSGKAVVLQFLNLHVQIPSKFITDLVHNLLIKSGLSVVIYMNRPNFFLKEEERKVLPCSRFTK